ATAASCALRSLEAATISIAFVICLVFCLLFISRFISRMPFAISFHPPSVLGVTPSLVRGLRSSLIKRKRRLLQNKLLLISPIFTSQCYQTVLNRSSKAFFELVNCIHKRFFIVGY